MKVLVNNKETELAQESSISDLATQLQLSSQGVAIAVNNRMIPRSEWPTHMLQANDSLVIIKAACGG